MERGYTCLGWELRAALRPSRGCDDGRPVATDETNVQNLPRDRRAEPSGEMERRAIAYRRLHGIGKRGVVGPAATRLYEHNPRLADNGPVSRETRANGDLIVGVPGAPAGGDPRRDAMNAGDQRWLGLSGLRSRPKGQHNNPDRGKKPSRLTSLRGA